MFKLLNFCIKRSVPISNAAFFQRIAPITSNVTTPDIKPPKTKPTQPASIYKPLYFFPPIKLISVVGRLKMFELGFTLLAIPSSVMLTSMGYLPSGIEYSVAFVGFSIFQVMCTFSFFFRNTIGMIYVTENEKKLKIVSCNFKGQRVDTIINTSDWMLFSELPYVKFCSAFYHTTKTYDGKHWWKMPHTNGQIKDEKLFYKLLGDPHSDHSEK